MLQILSGNLHQAQMSLDIYITNERHTKTTQSLPRTKILWSLTWPKWHCICKDISNIQRGTEISRPLDMAISAVYQTSYANTPLCTCCRSIPARTREIEMMMLIFFCDFVKMEILQESLKIDSWRGRHLPQARKKIRIRIFWIRKNAHCNKEN